MSLYKTKEGDRIDLIVLEHYGDLVHLNDVISANKVLWGKPMNLESGIEIVFPSTKVKSSDTKAKPKEREPLW